ncbi:MAG: Zn-dependent oligopeptidase [Parachlamydiales bacterium]|nr:Zn-dependent oligopeptidase [Parachlamydiales bacterium]
MLIFSLIATLPFIHTSQEFMEWVPMSEEAVLEFTQERLSEYEEGLNQVLSVSLEDRTFDNTVRSFDRIYGELQFSDLCVDALLQIHPDKAVRESLNVSHQKLSQAFLDSLANHPQLYAALQAVQNPSLKRHEKYFLDQLLLKFEQQGLQLPDERRSQFIELQKEIVVLNSEFERNIAEDTSELYLEEEELTGLEPEWIRSRMKEGKVHITADLPTYNSVLNDCSVRKTRKAVYELFNNRAFPKNEEVIKQLIAKQDKCAKTLGFQSYADRDLSTQMVGSVKAARAFLDQVKQKAVPLSDLEIEAVTESALLERFDEMYVFNEYKKKHFSVSTQAIAEYFPLEKTIEGLLHIYEQFFSLSIREVPSSLPIAGVKVLELRDGQDQFLGVVLMDLFPRPGKCSHNGVHFPLLPAFSPTKGPSYPAASLIIGNFTKPSEGRPSLLTHNEAIILFHEFGHAIHNLLGKNEFICCCGTRVKRDFVELPSQLLEKWLWEPEILKMISCHYITQQPLSDTLIQNMILANRFGTATRTRRSCCLSEIALAFFSEGEDKNPTEIMEQIHAQELPFSSLGSSHFHASWWHIPGYGPKFYSYLWSQVFACDLFEKIKKEGLLNPAAGGSYVQHVLSKGGGQDPNEILEAYLGRPPSTEPFFKQL